ncbi:hypothetical protein UFOVP116_365 [uncultured Caudovirales phage]|uniref:Cytidyltransferase-like domain-containing protein n=1 Tax=uncultured Caudovirales phage TaxID=2100421 RepID=A0A6J5L7B8_9CAUD|nr:hypothetical protein UFOVP116_365 [uncultured Caudovirales phage]
MNLFELFNMVSSIEPKVPVKNKITEGIDHPEDLIISSGMQGAQRAFTELMSLEADTNTVSLKWDGFPAVVFGRDEQGALVFVDKHMYDKVAKGKMEFSSIKDYDLGRGANRSDLWEKEAALLPALESAVPNVTNTFWMGDLMWTGTPKEKNDYFVFKPNTVEYRVGTSGELGKRIAGAVGGIAVHTFIPGLGASDTPLVGLKGLSEDAGIVFLVGEMRDKPSVVVSPDIVQRTKQAIDTHGPAVDKLIADLTAMKGKSVITAMGPFITSMLADNDTTGNIVPRFIEFLKGRLTPAASAKLLGENNDGWLLQESGGAGGLLGVWSIWAALTDLKLSIKQQIDTQQQGSEVLAIIDTASAHEGYVFGGGKDKLKLVDRLGFSRANFAKHSVSAEEEQEKSKMPLAVFCFGRMNPPTIGHKLLMAKTVEAGGDKAHIFLSNSHDTESNPLAPNIKAAFIKKIYPEFASNIVDEPVLGPIQAANWLYDQGYRNIAFVGGSDRLGNASGSIEKLLKSWNSGPIRSTDYARGAEGREFVALRFISSGERDADTNSVTGISGSLARKYAAAGDVAGFNKATGVSDSIKVGGKTLYDATRDGMGMSV